MVGPKFLRITDIVPSNLNWDTVPYCRIDNEKIENYTLKEGDIVIARTGATTGYAKRLNKRHPLSVFASYLVRLRIKEDFSNVLVGIIIQSEEYKLYIKSIIGGAAQPNANAKLLTSLKIVIPSKKLLKEFEKYVKEMLNQIEILQDRNSNLRKTRDFLLPKLISGKIDVSELNIDVGGGET